MCTAETNVQGRTGSDTRVRLNARPTGAVDPRFRYDSLVYSLHHESQDSIGCVRSDSRFSSRLPLSLQCSPHARIATAVHNCTIRVRRVQAGPRMLLCYLMLYPRMRSPYLLGYFPFQPTYIFISLSIRVLLFRSCRTDSLTAGAVVR